MEYAPHKNSPYKEWLCNLSQEEYDNLCEIMFKLKVPCEATIWERAYCVRILDANIHYRFAVLLMAGLPFDPALFESETRTVLQQKATPG